MVIDKLNFFSLSLFAPNLVHLFSLCVCVYVFCIYYHHCYLLTFIPFHCVSVCGSYVLIWLTCKQRTRLYAQKQKQTNWFWTKRIFSSLFLSFSMKILSLLTRSLFLFYLFSYSCWFLNVTCFPGIFPNFTNIEWWVSAMITTIMAYNTIFMLLIIIIFASGFFAFVFCFLIKTKFKKKTKTRPLEWFLYSFFKIYDDDCWSFVFFPFHIFSHLLCFFLFL